jgi:hypothetical protein
MSSLSQSYSSGQEVSKCHQCGAHAERLGVWPNGSGGCNFTSLCDEHEVIFRTQGPRALPNVWRSAVLSLAARLGPIQ